jgi:hypothetical protein
MLPSLLAKDIQTGLKQFLVNQARRIAELVARVPAFAGLRVGLYVGGNTGNQARAWFNEPGSVLHREPARRVSPAPKFPRKSHSTSGFCVLRASSAARPMAVCGNRRAAPDISFSCR